jgi:hypothetical protein
MKIGAVLSHRYVLNSYCKYTISLFPSAGNRGGNRHSSSNDELGTATLTTIWNKK